MGEIFPYFDLLKVSCLFVNDTLYHLQYVIENVRPIGPHGAVIDLSCGTRSYTIYAYSKLENISIYPFTYRDDICMDITLLLHRIHREAKLPTKELRIKLGQNGTFVQLKHLEDLQKWRLRCLDFMI
jgi:hypothetical protein